jgi:hypothetical protein
MVFVDCSSCLLYPYLHLRTYTFIYVYEGKCEPDSSVSIATELRAGPSGDRIPIGRVFPPIQTGPGTNSASCTMGTGSFPGVKYCWGVLLTTHPLLVPLSWKSRAKNLPSLWATTGPLTGKLYIYLYMRASTLRSPND